MLVDTGKSKNELETNKKLYNRLENKKFKIFYDRWKGALDL